MLDLWQGVRGGMGEALGVIAMWCEAHGLPASARLEVWERVCLVDGIVTDYHTRMADAQAKARASRGR